MKRSVLSAAACAAIVVSTAAFSQQDRWQRQVRAQLDAVASTFREEGYELTHAPYLGSLAEGATEELELELERGRSYYLVGVCDDDCSDLDLAVYDGAGDEIDVDVEPDDVPVVALEVTRSGAYTVEVGMAACSAEPCRYGLGVYAD